LLLHRIERDKQFAQKAAERASLRVHMRDKYRLPQSEKDDAQIQIVGGDVDLPEDLAKMVEQDEEEEEINDSLLGKIQNMDFDAIKTKAQTTLTEMKEAAEEKCTVM
ncbi:CPLX4 protein, partial [Polyodon spathula]|nr:CPLX4 protein [Polyodon spathula]